MTWSKRCDDVCVARRPYSCYARPAPLAAERDQLVVAAVTAVLALEAMRHDAAFEEGGDLVLDELRQVGPSLSRREKGRSALLHQVVQRGLFRAVALIVGRSSILRPLGLPANGLHARFPSW